MPNNIKAEAEVSGGVSTVTVSVDTRHHTETVPLHPTYPDGAPEEFMALDAMRRAIATVEKEGFPSLFDLRQTQEAAERAKELGLHQNEQRNTQYVAWGGLRGGSRPRLTGELDGTQYIETGVDPIGDTVRQQVEQRLRAQVRNAAESCTSYERRPVTYEDVRRAVQELDERSSPPVRADVQRMYDAEAMRAATRQRTEPAPIVTDRRLVPGRHIVTPDGAYTVDVLHTGMTIDQSTNPSLPSEEWIRSHLAHRLSQELAERLVVRNRDNPMSGHLRLEAEIIVLRRRTDGAN